MNKWSSSDDVPEMQQSMYDKAVKKMARESEANIQTVEDAYNFLHDFIEGYEILHVFDDNSEIDMSTEKPVRYFEWKTGENMVLGNAFYSEDTSNHPILDFDRDNFDRHVFYLSVSPDNYFYSDTTLVPEVTLYGASIDESEDAIYFGEMSIERIASRVLD